MYIVKINPDSDSRYVSQIYAGLYQLSSAGVINLKFAKTSLGKNHNNFHSEFNMLIEVMDSESKKSCAIFFDLVDGGGTFMMDELKSVDVYFKRTYYQDRIDTLPMDLRKKILPYGLHYCCRSRWEKPAMMMKRLLLKNFFNQSIFSNFYSSIKESIGRPLDLLFRGYFLKKEVTRLPLLIEDYVVHPDESTQKKIYFKTRVYDVNKAQTEYGYNQRVKVNEIRVGTIRALKKHFGRDFVGGLSHSSYACENYQDCLFPVPYHSHGQHIKKSQQYLININTAGLHRSVGWKFPEQMAASRCIVTEPVDIELPVPIEKGVHYLSFHSSQECVKACEQLLSDKNLSKSMRQNNYNYYKDNIEPSKLLKRCLNSAFLNLQN